MSSFTSKLIVSPKSNGKEWELCRSFTYRIGKKYSRRFIRIPSGFVTDFASIPKFLLPLLPSWAKINKPSPIHDYLYTHKMIMSKPITRKKADDIFYEAMIVDFRNHRSGKIVAWLEYWAVRLWGWKAWKPNKLKVENLHVIDYLEPKEISEKV